MTPIQFTRSPLCYAMHAMHAMHKKTARTVSKAFNNYPDPLDEVDENGTPRFTNIYVKPLVNLVLRAEGIKPAAFKKSNRGEYEACAYVMEFGDEGIEQIEGEEVEFF